MNIEDVEPGDYFSFPWAKEPVEHLISYITGCYGDHILNGTYNRVYSWCGQYAFPEDCHTKPTYRMCKSCERILNLAIKKSEKETNDVNSLENL